MVTVWPFTSADATLVAHDAKLRLAARCTIPGFGACQPVPRRYAILLRLLTGQAFDGSDEITNLV
jgi:hypothetical protein